MQIFETIINYFRIIANFILNNKSIVLNIFLILDKIINFYKIIRNWRRKSSKGYKEEYRNIYISCLKSANNLVPLDDENDLNNYCFKDPHSYFNRMKEDIKKDPRGNHKMGLAFNIPRNSEYTDDVLHFFIKHNYIIKHDSINSNGGIKVQIQPAFYINTPKIPE